MTRLMLTSTLIVLTLTSTSVEVDLCLNIKKSNLFKTFFPNFFCLINHAFVACDVDNDEEPFVIEGLHELFIKGCSSLSLFFERGLVSESTS